MWHKDFVVESYPTLSNTGRQIYKHRLVYNPSPVESWFSFAKHSDIAGLKRMLNKGFNINTINKTGCHIGLIACEVNNFELLSFFIKNQGDISYKNSLDNEDLLQITSYPAITNKMFKLIVDKNNISKFNEDNITLLLDSLIDSPLFINDSNLNKIKYLFKNIKPELHLFSKTYILNKLQDINNTPKIIYFLKGLDKLFINLKTSLLNGKTNQLHKI